MVFMLNRQGWSRKHPFGVRPIPILRLQVDGRAADDDEAICKPELANNKHCKQERIRPKNVL
jgi:hypothetical protein